MLILLKLLNLRATQMKCQKCWSVSPKYLEPSSHSGTLPFIDGSTTFQKWKNGAITRLFIPSIYSGNYLALIKSLIMGFHFSLQRYLSYLSTYMKSQNQKIADNFFLPLQILDPSLLYIYMSQRRSTYPLEMVE